MYLRRSSRRFLFAVLANNRLTAVLRIFSWLGEIGIRRLEHGILIPMSELSLHRCVARFALFYRSFKSILIFRIRH